MRSLLRPEPRLTWWIALLVGALPFGAAVGVGHLVAGETKATTSPFIAVANGTIDRSPKWLTDFAKEQFGAEGTFNDKFVLKLGIGATLVVIAIIAGLLTRRFPVLPLAAVVALGLVGIYAVYDRPIYETSDLRAPGLALVTGVAAFLALWWLATRTLVATAPAAPAETEATETEATETEATETEATETEATETESVEPAAAPVPGRGPDRRAVLVGSGVVAAGAALSGYLGERATGTGQLEMARRALGIITPDEPAPAIPVGADFAADGTPTFLTPLRDFYRVDINLTLPQIQPDDWRLKIHGMVDDEKTIDFGDLMDRRLVERTVTLTCVSNEVGGPYISTTNWTGVLLRDILEEVGVDQDADQIFTTSEDGWTCGTPVKDVMERDREAMLVVAWNREPLPIEHGFPVRMMVPGLYGFVSATKWIVDMELTTFEKKKAYWRERDWGAKAPIRTMSRIDSPGSFQKVAADSVVISGIAWAQPRGINKVEVQIDDRPWQDAELSTEVNPKTWRMWRLPVRGLGRGTHSARVRATDRDGYTQTSDRVPPIPGGATGWHSTRFVVQ